MLLMIVGFTGTQRGMTEKQKDRFCDKLSELGVTEFHHGDCVGADEQADNIVRTMGGIRIVIHPPDNDAKRAFCSQRGPTKVCEPKPYLERNHDIVDAAETMIATPGETQEQLRSGTWATIRYSRKTKKPGWILTP